MTDLTAIQAVLAEPSIQRAPLGGLLTGGPGVLMGSFAVGRWVCSWAIPPFWADRAGALTAPAAGGWGGTGHALLCQVRSQVRSQA
jgi:hypothetical protein